jgi:hypothetical protein
VLDPPFRDVVQGAVELAVTAVVDAVPVDGFAAGRGDRGDAGEGGERGVVAAASGVAEADQDLGGADRSDAALGEHAGS